MITSLLLAVVAVGVGAGAVAVVDETEGRVPVLLSDISCVRSRFTNAYRRLLVQRTKELGVWHLRCPRNRGRNPGRRTRRSHSRCNRMAGCWTRTAGERDQRSRHSPCRHPTPRWKQQPQGSAESNAVRQCLCV